MYSVPCTCFRYRYQFFSFYTLYFALSCFLCSRLLHPCLYLACSTVHKNIPQKLIHTSYRCLGKAATFCCTARRIRFSNLTILYHHHICRLSRFLLFCKILRPPFPPYSFLCIPFLIVHINLFNWGTESFSPLQFLLPRRPYILTAWPNLVLQLFPPVVFSYLFCFTLSALASMREI